ncbi:MAG TPA: response regulator [Solirubrobacteraceae bacterium]|nr:response regulator [Solirubrobacteraceae bacterium]
MTLPAGDGPTPPARDRPVRPDLEGEASPDRAVAGADPGRDNDDLLRLLVHGVEDYAILLLDPTGNVATWNAGAERLKGYGAAEIIGRHFSVFYPPEDIADGKPGRELAIAAADGRLEDEGWRVRKDGTCFWANVVITALRDPDGRLRGYGKITRDLTERRAHDERVREREQLVSSVLAAATECSIIGTDLDGTITIFNAGAERMLGYRAQELVGLQTPALLHDAGEVAARAVELGIAPGFEVLVADARVQPADVRRWTYIRKDGSRLPVEVTVTVLPGADGRPRGFMGIGIDVSQRRRVEDDLAAARDRALEASRLKSEFVANMSHELRTPLNGVIGIGGLLLDSDLDDEQREYAQAISASGDALLAVIDEILDFSKIEAGRLELDSAPFSVRDLVEEACTMVASTAHDKGLELISAIGGPLDGPLDGVEGDGPRLRQVLINLLTNAIKFTASGQIVVSVTDEPGQADRRRLRFEVADTGIGIDAAHLESIFDSFAQADTSTTRRYGGTGLGLAISRRLVNLMGGEIGVTSNPNRGSTFWFTITVDDAPILRDVGGHGLLPGVRTLIVDDNATSRAVLRAALTTSGMVCETAAGGVEALGRLAAATHAGYPYGLVLLDSQMPGMSGVELVVAVKADPALSATPLLMLASSGDARAAAASAGVAGFVAKPVRELRLRDEIERVLRPRDPVSPAGNGARNALPPASPAVSPDAERPQPLWGPVLVADDQPANRLVASRLLERRGFDVHVAENGRQVLEMHRNAGYDLVLMDCQMPELDGYQATTEIRRHDGTRHHTQIIAMTASTMKGDRERCLRAGMDDYLGKPLRPAMLDEALARALLRLTEQPPTTSRGDDDPRSKNRDLAPLLDGGLLDEICDTDDALRDELVAMFRDEARSAIDDLALALAAGDARAAQRSAHSLKGASSAIGARRLAAAAGVVANAATASHVPHARSAAADLTRIFALTLAALDRSDAVTSRSAHPPGPTR